MRGKILYISPKPVGNFLSIFRYPLHGGPPRATAQAAKTQLAKYTTTWRFEVLALSRNPRARVLF